MRSLKLPDVAILKSAHRAVWSLKRHADPTYVPPAAVLHQFAGARSAAARMTDAWQHTKTAASGHHPFRAMSRFIEAGAHAGTSVGAALLAPVDAVVGTSRSYGYGHQMGEGKMLPTHPFASARYALDVGLLGGIGAASSSVLGLVGGAIGALAGALVGSVVASFQIDRESRLHATREKTLGDAIAKGARIGATVTLSLYYPIAVVARAAVEGVRLTTGLVKLSLGAVFALVGATLGTVGSLPVGAVVAVKKAMGYSRQGDSMAQDALSAAVMGPHDVELGQSPEKKQASIEMGTVRQARVDATRSNPLASAETFQFKSASNTASPSPSEASTAHTTRRVFKTRWRRKMTSHQHKAQFPL